MDVENTSEEGFSIVYELILFAIWMLKLISNKAIWDLDAPFLSSCRVIQWFNHGSETNSTME